MIYRQNLKKILNAFRNCLSIRNNMDEDILEVCDTYNIEHIDLKAELILFGKICSYLNILKPIQIFIWKKYCTVMYLAHTWIIRQYIQCVFLYPFQ